MGEDVDSRPLRHRHRRLRRGVRHAELAVLARGGGQRVQRGLVVAGRRVADDDLDVVRAFRHPFGHELPGLAGAGDQAALADDGMRECGLPGAMAGVPALRMSVSPGSAQRVHQLGRRARHVKRGGDAAASCSSVDRPCRWTCASMSPGSSTPPRPSTIPAPPSEPIRRPRSPPCPGAQLPAVEHADVRHGGSRDHAAHRRLLRSFLYIARAHQMQPGGGGGPGGITRVTIGCR